MQKRLPAIAFKPTKVPRQPKYSLSPVVAVAQITTPKQMTYPKTFSLPNPRSAGGYDGLSHYTPEAYA